MTDTEHPPRLEVAQADRDAAAEWQDALFVHPDLLARAFARHRLASTEHRPAGDAGVMPARIWDDTNKVWRHPTEDDRAALRTPEATATPGDEAVVKLIESLRYWGKPNRRLQNNHAPIKRNMLDAADLLATLQQPSASTGDEALREAFLETREFLGLLEQAVCDWSCPSKWETDKGQLHSKLHTDLIDQLVKHESVRDAALTPTNSTGEER